MSPNMQLNLVKWTKMKVLVIMMNLIELNMITFITNDKYKTEVKHRGSWTQWSQTKVEQKSEAMNANMQIEPCE